MYIKFKNNKIKLGSLAPQIVVAVFIASRVYEVNGFDMVITSVNDSSHMRNSLHYSGNAVDLSIREIPRSILLKIVEELKKCLTSDFDIIMEKDHIHIEYQPRQAT